MDKFFGKFAHTASRAAGNPYTFILAVLLVIIWALSGHYFHYSETWQLVINSGTTIVTFLMVFIIQNTQNRDGAALQAKLDEIIRTSDAADEFVGIEKMSDKELEAFQSKFEEKAEKTHALVAHVKAERQRRSTKS